MVDTTEKMVETEAPNYLSMSDEEMLNMAPPTATAPTETPAVVKEETSGVVAPTQTTTEEVADDSTGAKQPGDKEAAESGDATTGEEVAAPKKSDAPKTEPEAKKEETKEAPAIDYEAEYKRLTAPFKANGKEIQVNSVDDAVALMQMGANYTKKMAALKPNLKLMKMLENNGLLSEEKIGFLIDLGKKDPAAISKLVKDSGVDPMDLDAEKASAYKQTAYAVDDREIELDTVLEDLKETPTYTRTLDVVSNKWDVASKQEVSKAPQLLKVLNDHMASGIYDLVSKEVERERMLGRLNGVSDLEAYRQTGDAINARGGFNHLNKVQEKTPPKEVVVVQPKPKAAEDEALKDKRRAASGTKPAAPSTAPADFNPLAMSDEEFLKMPAPKFR